MSDYGLMLGWGTPVRGREQKAMEVFLEAQELYGKAVANGEIADFETVLIEPGATQLSGFSVCWGTREQIDAFTATEDFGRMMTRAGLIVDDLSLRRCSRGDVVAEGMGVWSENISLLA